METANAIGTYYLLPGGVWARPEPHEITTVLGSCVSVCLWDRALRIGGMNHYMLPLWNGEGLASPKYGNIAITKLIERMLDLGCRKQNLRAKIFGGGEVLRVTRGSINVGERNVILARDLLQEERIPVVGEDVGGRQGRKIVYRTGSGQVLLKRLKQQVDDIRV